MGVTLASTTPPQGTCDEAAGVVTCNLGDLNPGASATVEIVVTPTVEGEISNTASVTSDVFDPNPVNNSATEIMTVSRFCTLDLAPSYDGGTLTIDVSVGTSVAASADMWGISQGNILRIVSGQAVPVIDPPIVQTITQAVTP